MEAKTVADWPLGAWVEVRALRCASGGGILDPDDRLADVADDRECIVASYEEDSIPSEVHPGRPGDGTSASSSGSPDLIDVSGGSSDLIYELENLPKTAIEVTGSSPGDPTLQVRRGSEPALNCLSPSPPPCPLAPKRWSATPGFREEGGGKPCESPPMEVVHRRSESHSATMTSPFSRDNNRLSMQFAVNGGSAIHRWMDSAERALALTERKEPVGASTSNSAASSAISQGDDRFEEVHLNCGSGPLGIHVVPSYDQEGQGKGLLVQGVEPGGKVHSLGTLHPGDTITHVNGTQLAGVTFQRAQEIFREALSNSHLRLGVTKQEMSPSCAQGQHPVKKEKEEDVLVEGMEKLVGTMPAVAMIAPTKSESDLTGLRSIVSHPSLIAANTRRIGRKLEIDLVKGLHGLGFSVTTRDNPAGGNCPIYIKNILPKGAAIDDGRLRPGDRLLEVNDVEMTGKSQSEAVGLLRNVPSGGNVHLVVSRQEREADRSRSPQLPREIPPEKAQEEGQPFPWKHREVMDLAIPVNDTETAGLGVSVKGKTATTTNGSNDLGIFVKSVLHGGAASRDGRLQPNDQLLRINGVALLGLNNSIAMETLRKAMQKEGPVPGAITLTVARRVTTPAGAHNGSAESFGGHSEEQDTSTTSEASEGTAIFLPPSQAEERNHQEKKGVPVEINRNPVVDRLMGQNPFRNESYYRATHETWSTSMWNPVLQGETSPNDKDTLIIEETHPLPNVIPPGPKPFCEDSSVEGSRSSVKEEVGECVTDATYASQTSLEEQAGGFLRDAFGRQSMSEKRHATLDARNTDTYQRNKKLRDERQRHGGYSAETFPTDRVPEQRITAEREDTHPVTQRLAGLQGMLTGTQLRPPRMGVPSMSRAASVESLLELRRLPPENVHHNRRSQRERDSEDKRKHQRRTYEAPPPVVLKKSASLESLQTIVQEGTDDPQVHCFGVPSAPSVSSRSAVRVSRGRGCNESFRAAVDRSYDGERQEGMDPLAEEETESNMSAVWGRAIVDNKKGRKKGLLKGLGNILKFGNKRKGDPPKLTEAALKQQQLAYERAEAQRVARAERAKIQEQYHRIAGHEELYVRRDRSTMPHPWDDRSSEGVHARTRSQDAFLELGRPGSRVGVADPRRAGHYINYQEIQHHLNKHWQQLYAPQWIPPNNQNGYTDGSRWQQQYHSQRCPPRERDREHSRPTSGYYEYESVLRGRGQRSHGSLPRKHRALPGSNV